MIKCATCGQFVSPKDSQCPHCGSMDRDIRISEKAPLAEAIGVTTLQERFERNRGLFVVLIAITVLSPFGGLVLGGWKGVALGLVLSIASLVIGFFAFVKVREIEHR